MGAAPCVGAMEGCTKGNVLENERGLPPSSPCRSVLTPQRGTLLPLFIPPSPPHTHTCRSVLAPRKVLCFPAPLLPRKVLCPPTLYPLLAPPLQVRARPSEGALSSRPVAPSEVARRFRDFSWLQYKMQERHKV